MSPNTGFSENVLHYQKDASKMDHKALEDIVQEICAEFSEMQPASLDQLERDVLNAMEKLGKFLVESKIKDWNAQLVQETSNKSDNKTQAAGRKKADSNPDE